MERVRTVIVGAGVTGLATAAALSARGDHDYLVLEGDREIGGYCKTITKEGFVWDYSGHFFHFRQHTFIDLFGRKKFRQSRDKTFTARFIQTCAQKFALFGLVRLPTCC